jgi:hypothetical protein
MRKLALLAGLAGLLATAPAVAADTSPGLGERISGVITAREGAVLNLRGADAQQTKVALTPTTKVSVNAKSSLGEVAPGEFIGCTAVEGPDGKLHAQEIHIIPEAMRGAGEGHYPWGNTPKTTMTNGNIEEFAAKTDGRALRVSYKGGEKIIEVDPETPVTKMVAGTQDQLTAGTPLTAFAQKGADGTLTASFIIASPRQ